MALTGNYIKQWRKRRKLSARELGIALGYRGREHVKKIESGAKITPRFVARFEAFKQRTQAREYREQKIESWYALPGRIKILAKPRRCLVCKEWFIFPDRRQKVCTARDCQREARRLSRVKRQRQGARSR